MPYQLATLNNLPNPFSKDNKRWKKIVQIFLERHKNKITVRKAAGTSIDRAKDFNKVLLIFLIFWMQPLRSINMQVTECSTWIKPLLSLKFTLFWRQETGRSPNISRKRLLSYSNIMHEYRKNFYSAISYFSKKKIWTFYGKATSPCLKVVCHPSRSSTAVVDKGETLPATNVANNCLTENKFIGPRKIWPVPNLKRKQGPRRGRAPGKAAVISSSLYKDELEAFINTVSSKNG